VADIFNDIGIIKVRWHRCYVLCGMTTVLQWALTQVLCSLWSVLKIVWKSWGAPSHLLPLSLIPSLSLPHNSPWAGGGVTLSAVYGMMTTVLQCAFGMTTVQLWWQVECCHWRHEVTSTSRWSGFCWMHIHCCWSTNCQSRRHTMYSRLQQHVSVCRRSSDESRCPSVTTYSSYN